MKKLLSVLLVVVLALGLLTGCGKKKGYTIGVPNDTTNEARALMLLEANGLIKLKEGAGITATALDIVENPYNITIQEVEAAQLPNTLKDLDLAVINANYAIEAGIKPTEQALALEGSASAYGNIFCVKSGREDEPLVKAVAAALQSKQVADYITENYAGAVISVASPLTDGYDSTLDYTALAGKSFSIAASPTPHAEILEVVKTILAAKDITLEIKEYNDYVLPNTVVEEGEIDGNYFQHIPYLDSFNAEQNTHIVSVVAVHVEPMGIYGGKTTSLDAIKK